MLRLEQMTDGSNTVYKLEYINDGLSIVKYFKDVDVESTDFSNLKVVDDGLYLEIE